MEHLDKKESCEFTLIGGSTCDLQRAPSSLMASSSPTPKAYSSATILSDRCLRCQLKTKKRRGELRSSSSNEEAGSSSNSSSSPESGGVILRWDEEDIMAWLSENDFSIYEDCFRQNAITCGRNLIALQEDHLKEMGVTCVGHRLDMVKAIEDLRKEAGLVSREKYVNISSLMIQMNTTQMQHTISLYPQRIIIIRHGESEGNVDNCLYATKPDRKMELTRRGIQQAYAAGQALKQLLQEESLCFYVSPFVRSRQTFEQVRQSFDDEQVLHVREDPRIREQEWGNFQDPSTMKEVMRERRKVGSFYYRFLTGESGADVYDRVSTFLETLYRDMEKGGCGNNAVLVSHGLFCRLFLMRYYHWKVEKFHKLWNFDNCQYAIMEKQAGGFYRLMSELKSDP